MTSKSKFGLTFRPCSQASITCLRRRSVYQCTDQTCPLFFTSPSHFIHKMIPAARCPADCSVSGWQLPIKEFLKIIIHAVIIALFLYILGILETITELLIYPNAIYLLLFTSSNYLRIKSFHLGPAGWCQRQKYQIKYFIQSEFVYVF